MKSTVTLEIIRILKWVNANKLTINTSKFSIVIVPPRINRSVDDSIIVTINSTPITVVKEVKYIDNKLTFGPHIAHSHMVHVEVKLSRSVGIQLKLKCFTFALTFETLLCSFSFIFVLSCGSTHVKLIPTKLLDYKTKQFS